MKIVHRWGALKLQKTISSSASVYQGSHSGFLHLPTQPSSRFHGLFWQQNQDLFRIIENITPEFSDDNVCSIENSFTQVTRSRDTLNESFFLSLTGQALIYELSKPYTVKLTLDVKKAYDNREWGRHYRIYTSKNTLFIEFVKHSHHQEDDSHHEREYSVYVAIKGYSSYRELAQFREQHYEQDHKRGSTPFHRHVYDAVSLGGQKLYFGIGTSEHEAYDQVHHIHKHEKTVRKERADHVKKLFSTPFAKRVISSKKLEKQHKLGVLNAIHSLDMLTTPTDDVYAGYPWFFQSWSRDTLVSTKAIALTDPTRAKKLLANYAAQVLDDGNMPNHVESHIPNADGVGWWAVRAREYSKQTPGFVNATKNTIRKLLKSHTHQSLATNDPQTTWMDTKEDATNSRSGARIELQAQRLVLYDLAHTLTKEHNYLSFANGLLAKTRASFFDSPILKDGDDDPTQRPNLFIAAYCYPRLLTSREWKTCLDHALSRLWCDWGGLSSIDKHHELFCAHHTGENNHSYHRGDSWFWINNLAAITLLRLDNQYYGLTISKILDASTHDVLWQGAIGCASEISSAQTLESKGCVNQAWSNALYIELIHEIQQNR